MKLLLLIGVGSFIGGISRYLLAHLIATKYLSTFPFGTLTVNILGCFLIGLLFGVSDKAAFSHEVRLFLVTGILGGFTTFSAFSMETVLLLNDGQIWQASAYVLTSVVSGLIATFLGIAISKFFNP